MRTRTESAFPIPRGPDRGGEAVRVPHRLYKEVFHDTGNVGEFSCRSSSCSRSVTFFTKKKILTSDIKNGLSTLLLKLVLPISILGSSQIAYDASTLSGFGITLVISFVFYFVFLFILRMVAKRLPLKDNADRVFPLLCVFGNVGFIGIPLSTQFFGPTGLMYAFSLNVALTSPCLATV